MNPYKPPEDKSYPEVTVPSRDAVHLCAYRMSVYILCLLGIIYSSNRISSLEAGSFLCAMACIYSFSDILIGLAYKSIIRFFYGKRL